MGRHFCEEDCGAECDLSFEGRNSCQTCKVNGDGSSEMTICEDCFAAKFAMTCENCAIEGCTECLDEEGLCESCQPKLKSVLYACGCEEEEIVSDEDVNLVVNVDCGTSTWTSAAQCPDCQQRAQAKIKRARKALEDRVFDQHAPNDAAALLQGVLPKLKTNQCISGVQGLLQLLKTRRSSNTSETAKKRKLAES